MDQIEFLQTVTPEQIRKNALNIIESYNHHWDILAELIQNAVDATTVRADAEISKAKGYFPQIRILVDKYKKRLTVWDNGCGIPISCVSDDINILRPDTTRKKDRRLVGHKGVGLTYAAFVSGKISITSIEADAPSGFVVTCENPRNWLIDEGVNPPRMTRDVKDRAALNIGEWSTCVEVTGINNLPPSHDNPIAQIYTLNAAEIELIFRTRTFVGHVSPSFFKLLSPTNQKYDRIGPESLKIELCVIEDEHQSVHYRQETSGYLWPHEVLENNKKNSTYSYDEFSRLLREQKNQRLVGKSIWKYQVIERAGRVIGVYYCVVPNRKTWSEINALCGVKNTSDEEETDAAPDDDVVGVSAGIFLATKGMPTGIAVSSPARGYGISYWPQVFMLIEDHGMSFDIGRKSPVTAQAGMYRNIAGLVFREINKDKILSWISTKQTSLAGPKKQVAPLREMLPEAVRNRSGFSFSPGESEAAVMAMFFHLVGKGELGRFRALRARYSDSYDCLLRFTIRKDEIEGQEGFAYHPSDIVKGLYESDVTIEFKYEASAIIDDVEDQVKNIEDIGGIVCWKVDFERFKKHDIRVEEIELGYRLFPLFNYQIDYGRLARPIPILSLSKLFGLDPFQHP